MKPNYVPNEDRVVVSVLEQEEQKTESGIYIPAASETHPLLEVVVKAVGDGVKSNGQNINMYLKPGQRVVIGRRTGVEYDMLGETFRIIRQEDVQFIVGE
jgi:chaperonin GroES